MTLVGLTGGIATGKSAVAKILTGMGVPVVDADQVARAVVAKGEPALARIVDTFGPAVLAVDGSLDRAALRSRIVRDAGARRRLEAITHPAIRAGIADRVRELAEQGHDAVVVEAALLVETGSYRDYALLIVVSASPEVQVARLVARDGVSEREARETLRAQLPVADKEAAATHVIRNDGDRDALENRVREVWQAIRAADVTRR